MTQTTFISLALVVIILAFISSVFFVVDDTIKFMHTDRGLVDHNATKEPRREKVVAVFFSLILCILLVFDIAAIAIMASSGDSKNWTRLTISCTLLFITCTQIARLLRVLLRGLLLKISLPIWINWPPYGVAVLCAIPDAVLDRRRVLVAVYYEAVLFIVFGCGQLLSATLPYYGLQKHQRETKRNQTRSFKNKLKILTVTYVAAALCMLGGAVPVLCLIPRTMSDQLLQGIYLGCIAAQLMCTFPFVFGKFKNLIVEPVRALRRNPSSTTICGEISLVDFDEGAGS